MDWSCNAHDRWPHPKAPVSLWAFNRYLCTRSSTQELQRCCQVLLTGMQHSSDGMGSLNPWLRILETGCLTRIPNVWVKMSWWPGEEETGQKGATKEGFMKCGLPYLRTTLCLRVRALKQPTTPLNCIVDNDSNPREETLSLCTFIPSSGSLLPPSDHTGLLMIPDKNYSTVNWSMFSKVKCPIHHFIFGCYSWANKSRAITRWWGSNFARKA